MSEAPQGFQPARPWPAAIRLAAVTLWCGFLGATLLLLCLLMAWHYLWPDTPDASWPVLAGLFVIGWLCSSSAVVMGLSLAAAPSPQLLESIAENSEAAADD